VNQMYQLIESPQQDDHFWPVMREATEAMILLISPIVPHVAEELWQALGRPESIVKAAWPRYREDALKTEEILIVVQVNGKLRNRITVPADATDAEIEQAAIEDTRIRDFIAGKPIRKMVVIPGKLINIVI